eukprot:TRINITY_DN8866_c0_g1_i3.p1 TRINITY_DN8866_c0_g1~~TRINITY_DN8866_c0_g1_i3.p1  ORF type:complete len:276 (+),score=6.87 TRINITY_DN8866_c0_g1_i3:45-872(+)
MLYHTPTPTGDSTTEADLMIDDQPSTRCAVSPAPPLPGPRCRSLGIIDILCDSSISCSDLDTDRSYSAGAFSEVTNSGFLGASSVSDAEMSPLAPPVTPSDESNAVAAFAKADIARRVRETLEYSVDWAVESRLETHLLDDEAGYVSPRGSRQAMTPSARVGVASAPRLRRFPAFPGFGSPVIAPRPPSTPLSDPPRPQFGGRHRGCARSTRRGSSRSRGPVRPSSVHASAGRSATFCSRDIQRIVCTLRRCSFESEECGLTADDDKEGSDGDYE